MLLRAGCVALLLSLLPQVSIAAPLLSVLDGFWDDWRASVEPFWTEEEHELFEELETVLERERFVRGFWSARSVEALRKWSDARTEALRRFDDLRDPRSLGLLLAGLPEARSRSTCGLGVSPFEVWKWKAAWAIFRLDRSEIDDAFVWWDPAEGLGVFADPEDPGTTLDALLARADRARCFPSARDRTLFRDALGRAWSREKALDHFTPRPVDPGWTESFRHSNTQPLSGTSLELATPGRYQRRTILEGRLEIPVAALERSVPDRVFDTLTATGEIRRGNRLLDTFRITWWIVGPPPDAETLQIRFHRRVLPGPVDFEVRLENDLSLPLLHESRRLEIPRLESPASPPPGRKGFGERTRAEVAFLIPLPSIEILPLPPPPHLGEIDVAVATTGASVDSVRFRVDGQDAGSDVDAPWSARIDLGDTPRDAILEAAALDPDGRVLDRARALLRSRPDRAAIRITETGEETLRLRIQVDIPSQRSLDDVVIRAAGKHLATRTSPAFELDVPSSGSRATLIEAVARFDDRTTAQAVHILGGPTAVVDVRLVEVEATVHDRQDHLVRGLPPAAFHLLEDGQEQSLLEVSEVFDHPLDIALVLDASSSMRPRVTALRRAAQRFLRTTLRRDDRASVLAFDHEIRRLVPFSAETSRLEAAISNLRAWGNTRLYDAIYFALASFEDTKSRRALIVLSDGEDIDSDLGIGDVRDEAVRSGVILHAILLDVRHEATRNALQDLAQATGGRAWSIADVGNLDRVYRRIEQELRAAYRLVYAAPPGGTDVRRIDVDVDGNDLHVRSRTAWMP